MMNWSELLADLRSDLQDTSSTPKWSDKMLYLYAKDAIRDYSTWFPKRIDRAALTKVSSAYALPNDYVDVIHVECPLETFLEQRNPRPGARYPSTSKVLFYFIQGGSLYLNADTALGVSITYFATHNVPASETDATCAISVPAVDIELIRLYVRAKVYVQMRGRQSALDRFKTGTGTRDDNPLNPEVQDLMEEYRKAIAERVRGGFITLYRQGRSR